MRCDPPLSLCRCSTLVVALALGAGAPSRLRAAPVPRGAPFAEVKGCRDAEQEGEFLQTCVKLLVGRRAGQVLGPGLVAPTGRMAAVVHHRRYGKLSDRVTVRIFGPDGKLATSFPMGAGGEEFLLSWAPGGRFLGWIEVDGRGGLLKVVDCRRRRVALSAPSPLEQWPVFPEKGTRPLVMLPRRATTDAPVSERVQSIEVVDLQDRSRKVVLSAIKDEELVDPRWLAPELVGATLRKIGAAKGKPVQGKMRPRPPPPEKPPDAGEAAPDTSSSDSQTTTKTNAEGLDER
jgi:hypothetical protein